MYASGLAQQPLTKLLHEAPKSTAMLGKNIGQTIATMGLGLGIFRFGINFAVAETEGASLWFSSLPLAAVALGVTIVTMIWTGYRLRQANKGLIDLQTAFLSLLGVYALAGLFTVVGNAFYLQVLRPEMLAGLEAHADRLSLYGTMQEYFSSLIFGGLLAQIGRASCRERV
jgi:FtsH-binding integral membrane protein